MNLFQSTKCKICNQFSVHFQPCKQKGALDKKHSKQALCKRKEERINERRKAAAELGQAQQPAELH